MELILQTEKEALKFRLAAVLLSVLALYVARLEAWLPAVLLTLGYLVYVVLLRAFFLPRFTIPGAVYGMVVVDVAVVTLALTIVGKIGSPIFVLFPVLILYYSIHLGYVSSLATATLSSLAYSSVALLTGEAEWFGAFLSFQVPLFYLLAFMGGFLAEKRFEERREKESLQESLQEAIGLERGARSLLDVTKALGNTLEMGAVLNRVLHSALGLGGVKASMVALPRKEDGRLVVRASNLSLKDLRESVLNQAVNGMDQESPMDLALKTLSPQLVPDLKGDTAGLPQWLRTLPYDSLVVTPLVHQEKALGALFLLGENFRQDRLVEAKSLGELAGMALFNAMVYEESQSRVTHLKEEFEQLVGRVEKLRQAQKKRIIEVDRLQVDLFKNEVTIEGKPVKLSPIEFELLSALAQNAGESLTHNTLLRLVWGPEHEGQISVVDVTIHRLRRKIEADPSRPKRIVTVRGVGYMLTSGRQPASGTKAPLPFKKVI